MDLALDLADRNDGFGLFGRGGGLQRLRRIFHAIFAGDRDGDESGLLSGARRLTAGNRDPPSDGIA